MSSSLRKRMPAICFDRMDDRAGVRKIISAGHDRRCMDRHAIAKSPATRNSSAGKIVRQA
jgi:hypothetical protein